MIRIMDNMRFALIDPKDCSMCQRKLAQVKLNMRLNHASEAAVDRMAVIVRCEGHREA